MSRDYSVLFEDIMNAMNRIESYTRGLSFSQFRKDEMRIDAVLRNLSIIGEATKKIPPAVRRKNTEIE